MRDVINAEISSFLLTRNLDRSTFYTDGVEYLIYYFYYGYVANHYAYSWSAANWNKNKKIGEQAADTRNYTRY